MQYRHNAGDTDGRQDKLQAFIQKIIDKSSISEMDKLDTDECRKLIMITSLHSLGLRKQLMEEEERRV